MVSHVFPFLSLRIETRAPNMALVIDELPGDDPGETQLVRVFPQLSFTNSIMLVDPKDGSNRLFHVSQSGVISVFPNTADPFR